MADAKKERLTLTVTEVKEPEKVGAKQIPKLSFKAKTVDGKEAWYFTFKQGLFGNIKAGPLDVDIETSEREHEGNIYVDRKLVEVYKDGQAVGGQTKGGWQPRQDSPETRRSIERQTSLHIAVQLSEPGTTTIEELLEKAGRIYDWLAGKQDRPVDRGPRQEESPLAQIKTEKPLDKPLDIEHLKDAVNAGVLKKSTLKGWGLPEFTEKTLAEYVGKLTKEQRFQLDCNVASAMKAKSEGKSLEESLQ